MIKQFYFLYLEGRGKKGRMLEEEREEEGFPLFCPLEKRVKKKKMRKKMTTLIFVIPKTYKVKLVILTSFLSFSLLPPLFKGTKSG